MVRLHVMVSEGKDKVGVNVVFEFTSEEDFAEFIKKFIPEAERWGLEINLEKRGVRADAPLTK